MPGYADSGGDPAVNPKYVIDDSPLKASIITVLSLVFFGITLAGAIVKLASAHDLNGIRALLGRDDVIGWLTTVATMLTPFAWAIYRGLKSWFNKVRDVDIAKAAPNAMLKSELAPMPAMVSESSPSRAPETKTRLVGLEALEPMTAVPMPPVAPPAPPKDPPVFAARTVIAGVDVTRLEDKQPVPVPVIPIVAEDPGIDLGPDIPGDALSMPSDVNAKDS